MYCDHFKLSTPPFSNTPDPRFFFNTPDHEEALASLLYVAGQRKGFALVTGEVGTGKTLVGRMLLGRLPAGCRTAMVSQAHADGPDLLRAICDEFQIALEADLGLMAMTRALETFLLDQYSRDRLAVVILDEAQTLTNEAFEQIRLLGNLEAEDAKLLQVLILAQPELSQTLARNDMRQFRQRIFRTFTLRPMTVTQTAAYIQHRLDVAGGAGRRIFTDEAVRLIAENAHGLPRLINQICDNALLTAYGQGIDSVSAAIIRETMDQIPACGAVAVDFQSSAVHAEHRAAPPPMDAAPEVTLSVPSDHVRHEIDNLRDRIARTENENSRLARLVASQSDALARLDVHRIEPAALLDEHQSRMHEERNAWLAELTAARAEISAASSAIADQRRLAESDFRKTAQRHLQEQLDAIRAASAKSAATAAPCAPAIDVAEHRTQIDAMAARANEIRAGLVDAIGEAKRRAATLHVEFDDALNSGTAHLGELRTAVQADLGNVSREALTTIERAQQEARAAGDSIDATLLRLREEAERTRARATRAIDDADTRLADAARRAEETAGRIDAVLSTAHSDAAALRGEADARRVEARDAIESLRIDADGIVHRSARLCDELDARGAAILASAREGFEQAREESERAMTQAADGLASVSGRAAAHVQAAQDDAERVIATIQQRAADLSTELHAQADREFAALGGRLSSVHEGFEQAREESERAMTQAADGLAGVSGRAGALVQAAQNDAERVIGTIQQRATDLSAELNAQADQQFTTLDGRLSRRVVEMQEAAETTVSSAQARIDKVGTRLQELTVTMRSEVESQLAALNNAADDAICTVQTAAQKATSDFIARRDHEHAELATQAQQIHDLCSTLKAEHEQARVQAQGLLIDARTSAADLREQSQAMVSRAQDNAERLVAAARAALDESRGTAERLRETATDLVRRTEGSLADLRRQTEALRDEVRREADTVRQDVAPAVMDTRTAQGRTDDLLLRAEGIAQQAQRLFNLPQEVIAEAREQAQSLANLSRSMQEIIGRLTQISAQTQQRTAQSTAAAEQRTTQLAAHVDARLVQLAHATRAADARLAELATQSGRISQLVGVVRRMYSSNSQIEQMRERVTLAAEMAIAQASPALAESATPRPAAEAPRTTNVIPRGMLVRTPAAATAGGKQAAAPRSQSTLGELVAKNTRLNAWLKKTIAEKEPAPVVPSDPAPATADT